MQCILRKKKTNDLRPKKGLELLKVNQFQGLL